MICHNCGECVPPGKITVIKINDTEGNPIITRIICLKCGKKFALALLKAREKEGSEIK